MSHSIKSGINAAKTTNQPFQLLWKGAEIQLLVGQIKSEDVEDARVALDDSKKGLTEIKGKCSFDADAKKIVFFSSAAPTAPTFPGKIRTFLSKHASITLDAKNVILTKKKTDLLYAEEDGATAKPEPPSVPSVPTRPPGPTGSPPDKQNGAGTKTDPVQEAALLSSFKRRQKELLGNAVKASEEVKVKIKELMAKAVEMAGSTKFDDADALLDEVEELLAPSDTGQTDDPAAVEYRQKLAALESRFEAAKKAKNGDVAKMQLAFKFTQEQAADGNYASATKGLLQLEKLLSAADASAQQQGPPEVVFQQKLTALEPRYQDALKNQRGDVSKMRVAYNFAQAQAGGGAYDKANNALKQLEQLLNAADASAQQDGGTAEKDGVFVAMQIARLAWTNARKDAQLELESLRDALVEKVTASNADPSEEEECNIDTLKKNAQKLFTVLDILDEDLIKTLDDGLNATTKAVRTAKHLEAKGHLKRYMTALKDDPFLAEVDNHGFGTTKIRLNFVKVCTDLAKKLT